MRRAVCARTAPEAATALAEAAGTYDSLSPADTSGVAFLFPGQGTQWAGMGAELYRTEPVYRREVDRCAELLEPSSWSPTWVSIRGR